MDADYQQKENICHQSQYLLDNLINLGNRQYSYTQAL